jgi:hypothetical protein
MGDGPYLVKFLLISQYLQVNAGIILWDSLSRLHLSIHRPYHLILFNAIGFTTLLLNSAPTRNLRRLPLKNNICYICLIIGN